MDSDKVERLRERLLQCAVCMEEYKDPRILPCHHTLCFECIESVVQASSASGRFFRCPQCRSDVCVPRGGTKDLPINFYIISLQDELGSTGYSGTCDVCRREWLITQFRCIDCDLDICKFCIHAHRLETHSDPPKILRVESTASPSQLSSSPTCPDHPDESLQLFCSTCSRAICVTCSCSGHRRHSFVPVGVKLQESQAYLQGELDKLSAEKRRLAKVAKDLEGARAGVLEACNKCMLSIDAQAHRACEIIMNKKSQIVKEILLSEKNQTDAIDIALKDFKSYEQRIERGLAFLLDLQDTDICLEVVDTYKGFSQKLSVARKDFVSNHIKIEQLQLTPSGFNQMYDLNFGLWRKMYHIGSLGALSLKRFCLSINPQTMELVLKPKRIVQIIETSVFKKFVQFLISFFFCQLLFYIADITGLFSSLSDMSASVCEQIMTSWLFFSDAASKVLQL